MSRAVDAAKTLERWRATRAERKQRERARAALVIGGLTLDADHLRALKLVQKALHAPSRAAAIRAAIMLAAEAIDRSRRHEPSE